MVFTETTHSHEEIKCIAKKIYFLVWKRKFFSFQLFDWSLFKRLEIASGFFEQIFSVISKFVALKTKIGLSWISRERALQSFAEIE